MSQMPNLQAFIKQSTLQNVTEFFFNIINFKSESNYLLNLEKFKDFNLKVCVYLIDC